MAMGTDKLVHSAYVTWPSRSCRLSHASPLNAGRPEDKSNDFELIDWEELHETSQIKNDNDVDES